MTVRCGGCLEDFPVPDGVEPEVVLAEHLERGCPAATPQFEEPWNGREGGCAA
jgi:hypothetical protein